MVIGIDYFRDMRGDEADEIDRLLNAAFGGNDEVDLVHRLRRDGDMFCEMVAPHDGRIAGYAALSRMVAPEGWLCLAPVAVRPDLQRGTLAPKGQAKQPWQVGRRLVTALVDGVLQMGAPAVVVLGHPDFYRQCGFSSQRAARLKTPYPVAYTLLAAPGDAAPDAELIYPRAFG